MMKKEIIYTEEMHGLVFNEKTILFDKGVCQELLNSPLDDIGKRELLQSYYVHLFVVDGQLSAKTNYGDLNVSFDKSVYEIEKYIEPIKEKLLGQVTWEEIEKNTAILENVFNMNEEEKEYNEKNILPQVLVSFGLGEQDINTYKKMKL